MIRVLRISCFSMVAAGFLVGCQPEAADDSERAVNADHATQEVASS